MIQPNELRIGNCVLNIHGEMSMIMDGKMIDKFEWWYPIPLTEEWLIKFGFKIQNKLNIQDGTNTWFKEGMNEYLSFHYNGFAVYESTKKLIVKSVHQLQNLFFALTEEELELKKESA